MTEGGRPRRHCASKRTAAPSAVHYVGYVEDDETPEMIMKKFEELEKVRQAAADPAALRSSASTPAPYEEETQKAEDHEEADLSGLTDEQLLEVFKQTSTFNVRSTFFSSADPEAGLDRWSDTEDLEEEGPWGDSRGFWSDEEDADYSEHRKKVSQSKASRKEGGVRTISRSKQRHDTITTYNAATRALIRKKVRAVDKDALIQIKIPFPLPLSWGRTVKPYTPASAKGGTARQDDKGGSSEAQLCNQVMEQDNISAMDWSTLPKDFQGLLINPGWVVPGATGAEATVLLSKLPIHKLCPVGFVFIWVKKQHISAVVRQMSKWGFGYIENLSWVFLHPNHSVMRLPSTCLRSSHLTLFLFRKEGLGKDIELRHQRKPDVVFDTLRTSPCQAFEVPAETYETIELMLPSGRDHFLELWAKPGLQRPGWMQIAETRQSERHDIAAFLQGNGVQY